ncbi:MAG: asparagine synthase (glutamine-hydrolyzing) [Planctomycetota bacterium]
MCGICGWVFADRDYPVPEALLRQAAGRMIHRGPDHEGIYAGVGVGLAMRRLAIIDLADGDQPMWTDDRRYVIVYNGECYNHDAIRADLVRRGHTFHTRCDTEAVLNGYAEWGTGVLDRMNGMFAFAIWDLRERSLFLARDRLGIKPLYLCERPDRFAFASEAKCLFADPAIPCEPDRQAVSDFLTFKYVPAPRTGFEGVRKLPPGHWARLADGRLTVEPYYDLPLDGAPLAPTDAEEAVAAILDEAVGARLMSDVPLGVMLSGGVDSSLVAAAAAERKAGVGTYCIGFRDPAYDESGYARTVAGRLGTQHHEETTEPDALTDLPLLARHLEEPFGDSSALPLLALCRMASRHVKTALAGDGGDELGAGYPRYYWDRKVRRLARAPGLLPLARLGGRALQTLARTRELGRRMEKLGRTGGLPDAERYAAWFAVFRPDEKAALLTPDVAAAVDLDPGGARLRPHFARAAGAHPLTRLQYVDLKTFLPDDLLLKADRISMAVSLELRVPFLDHRVAETLLRVPPEAHLAGGELKAFLKRLAARRVPPEVVYRRKQGFEAPLARWFREGLAGAAAARLGPDGLGGRGWVRNEPVQALLDAARLGRTDVGHKLYALLYLEAWLRAFWP